MPSRPTRYALQHSILELFDFCPFDSAAREDLEQRARRIAMLSTQPIYILRETLQYLSQQRIVAPTYAVLQDMVGRVVTGERKRITDLLGDALTPKITEQLATSLQPDESPFRIRAPNRQPQH